MQGRITDHGGNDMDILSAVVEILLAEGKPLHYKEITRLAIERGYWSKKGKAPESILNSEIALELRRHGKRSRFQRVGPGIYGLREWGIEEYSH